MSKDVIGEPFTIATISDLNSLPKRICVFELIIKNPKNIKIKFFILIIINIFIIYSSINEITSRPSPNKTTDGIQVDKIIGICSDVPKAIKSLCIK